MPKSFDVQPVAAAPRRDPEPGGAASPREHAEFLLEVNASLRRAESRAMVFQSHGRLLRARRVRRHGVHVRRLIVQRALVAAAAGADVPVTATGPREQARPAVKRAPQVNAPLLERISAYHAGPAVEQTLLDA